MLVAPLLVPVSGSPLNLVLMGHIVGLGLGYPEPYKHVPIVHLNQGLGMGVHANPDYLHSGVLVPFTGGKAWVEDGVQSNPTI